MVLAVLLMRESTKNWFEPCAFPCYAFPALIREKYVALECLSTPMALERAIVLGD